MSPDTIAEACIPVSYRSAYVSITTDNDLLALGKENLYYLARVWEKCAEKAKATMAETTNSDKLDRLSSKVRAYSDRARHLRTVAKDAFDKPKIFERPVLHIGSRVTCFLMDPDRFVSGTLAKVVDVKNIAPVSAPAENTEDDEDSKAKTATAKFVIRVSDSHGSHDYTYTPDILTLYPTEDFEFYRSHPKYLGLTLRLRMNVITPSELAFIDRILNALPGIEDEDDTL